MGKIIGLTFPEKKTSKYVCLVCGKEFTKKADLLEHMKMAHPEDSKQEPEK